MILAVVMFVSVARKVRRVPALICASSRVWGRGFKQVGMSFPELSSEGTKTLISGSFRAVPGTLLFCFSHNSRELSKMNEKPYKSRSCTLDFTISSSLTKIIPIQDRSGVEISLY